MNDGRDYVELVRQAQFGDRGSMDGLAELVRGRLYAYVYRIVMQEDLAQDIVQESMLEMVNCISKLEEAERFWPWLRGIAFNRIHHYFNVKQRHKTISMTEIGGGDEQECESGYARTGIGELIGKELKEIVFRTMWELKPKHRAVLAMRCYEDMSYGQIAELMDSSELGVRVLFYRAKKALQRRLGRRGYGKGALLTILAIFGRMTAPSKAAAAEVTVTAGTTTVGAAASIVGSATSGTSILTLAAVGAMTVGAVVAPSWVDKAAAIADKANIAIREKVSERLNTPAVVNKEREEYWYYYPDGAEGPVMMRQVKSDSDGGQFCCRRLENDAANYRYDKAENRIYIEDSRMWNSDLTVRRLPSDKAQMSEFLSRVEGRPAAMEYISGGGRGLLAIVVRDGNSSELRTSYNYNVPDEEYFRYDWPTSAEVVDNRDAMHKRGWTYFRISGEINGKEVTGAGRMPFVSAASKEKGAWLRLKAGDGLEITDSSSGAQVCEYGKGKFPAYPAYSFFKGLSRPWMGLHSIDTVRRDAAEEQMWFTSSYTQDSEKAEVTLTKDKITLIYTIDMKRDVVEKIVISAGDRCRGELRFSYVEDVEGAEDEFAEPRIKDSEEVIQKGLGILWLERLTEESSCQ